MLKFGTHLAVNDLLIFFQFVKAGNYAIGHGKIHKLPPARSLARYQSTHHTYAAKHSTPRRISQQVKRYLGLSVFLSNQPQSTGNGDVVDVMTYQISVWTTLPVTGNSAAPSNAIIFITPIMHLILSRAKRGHVSDVLTLHNDAFVKTDLFHSYS
jgi:hypothetical protein